MSLSAILNHLACAPQYALPHAVAARHVSQRLRQLALPFHVFGEHLIHIQRLYAWQQHDHLCIDNACCVVCASENSVADHSISRYATHQSFQIAQNVIGGCAALNQVLDVPLYVFDMGLSKKIENASFYEIYKQSYGRDIIERQFMSHDTFENAYTAAYTTYANLLSSNHYKCCLLGEIGVGNTLHASLITSLICSREPQQTVGLGSGLSRGAWIHKVSHAQRALKNFYEYTPCFNPRNFNGYIPLLSGELIGIMAGIVACFYARTICIIDSAYALCALALLSLINPHIKGHCFIAQNSLEPSARLLTNFLELTPLMQSGFACGEALSSVISYNFLKQLTKVYNKTALSTASYLDDKAHYDTPRF